MGAGGVVFKMDEKEKPKSLLLKSIDNNENDNHKNNHALDISTKSGKDFEHWIWTKMYEYRSQIFTKLNQWLPTFPINKSNISSKRLTLRKTDILNFKSLQRLMRLLWPLAYKKTGIRLFWGVGTEDDWFFGKKIRSDFSPVHKFQLYMPIWKKIDYFLLWNNDNNNNINNNDNDNN